MSLALRSFNSVVIRSHLTDPYANLSIGTYLSKKVGKVYASRILFLCSSHQGVFVGKNQNCWYECDILQMKRDGISLIRRDTGGGACFVDGGNRLFGFIESDCDEIHKRNMPIIVNALNQLDLKGKKAVVQGRNDIAIDGIKISGSAYSLENRVQRHHGTLLVNVNKGNLGRYLTPPKIKLESKGVKSVAARICNLVDINPSITHEAVDIALINSFLSDSNAAKDCIIELNEENFSQIIDDYDLFERILERYKSDEFLYNENPPFALTLEDRFSFGIVQIYLQCSENKIAQCKVFSDSLDLKLVECIRQAFEGKDYNHDLPEKIYHDLALALTEDYNEIIEEFCLHLHSMMTRQAAVGATTGLQSLGDRRQDRD